MKKKLVKAINKAIKNDYLYSDEEMRYMKQKLSELKNVISEIEIKNYKGFGKKV